jgi:hypothetical protein
MSCGITTILNDRKYKIDKTVSMNKQYIITISKRAFNLWVAGIRDSYDIPLQYSYQLCLYKGFNQPEHVNISTWPELYIHYYSLVKILIIAELTVSVPSALWWHRWPYCAVRVSNMADDQILPSWILVILFIFTVRNGLLWLLLCCV